MDAIESFTSTDTHETPTHHSQCEGACCERYELNIYYYFYSLFHSKNRNLTLTGKSKLIVLDIVTQAGTYVKELVHGEFGRTEPSIASMMNLEIDIVALDVMDIDLNFPKSLNR
jgi:hypothetical protein